MVVLHIAALRENKANGMYVVVPQHIIAQQKIATVGFINIRNVRFDGVENQIAVNFPFDISTIPEPFNNPDLVVFHGVYIPEFTVIAKELLSKKIPYIIVPHGSLTREAQQKKYLKKLVANIFVFGKFIKNAVSIQYLSEMERKNSSKFFHKSFIGTNGIFSPNVLKKGFSQKGVNFVYIGRLDPFHKGLDLMLGAVSKERDFLKKNNCTLHIYGPSSENWFKEVESLIKKNAIDDIVSLKEAVFGLEKESKLLDADIFIQTSRFEGMPMGILEALSYGIPCIVTNGTYLGDVVSEYNSGWRAETNINSIAQKMVQATNERDLWGEKSVNSKKLIEEKFNWNVIASKAIDEYKRLIKY